MIRDQPAFPQRLTVASHERLMPALLLAVAIHLCALLLTSFAPPPEPLPETALDVTILRDPAPATSPPAPDAALAPHTQTGESPRGDAAATTHDEPLRQSHAAPEPAAIPAAIPASAKPQTAADNQTVQVAPAPPPGSAAPEPAALVASIPSPSAPSVPLPDPLSQPRAPADMARILASQGTEIARLTSSLEASVSNQKNRVRRKSISASTREYRYANYLGAWARKVERIGNLNYPQAAREQQLYGSLILHVAVRADGRVERIRVVHSSGVELLDQAAIRIVELAAPYAPFPPDIAAETDVLDIVRTWQFMRGDVMGWER